MPQGTDVQVRITITNVGQNSVSGVTVRVGVPAGFVYLGTVGTSSNGNSERDADIAPKSREATLTWGSWTMGPGGSGTKSQVLITAQLEATGSPGTRPFAPQVFATGFDNSLSGTPLNLTVAPAPTLGLTLRASPAAAAAGQVVTYVLTVTNTGSGAAPSVNIGLTLPDDFDYQEPLTTSGNSGTSSSSYPTIGTEGPVWSGFDIPGASSSGPGVLALTFQVMVLEETPAGTYTCSASTVASTGSQTQNYIQQNYTALAPVQVTAP